MGKWLSRFQWVRCQLDSLRRCITTNDLETALKTLPNTLDATYNRILLNIPEEQQEKFKLILQFLCFSERPMRLDELAEVVTVAVNSEGNLHYDWKNRMGDISYLLAKCGSLVSLSSRSHRFWKTFQQLPISPEKTIAERIVQLSHFSVKEYLMSRWTFKGEALGNSFNAELANRSIAMTCLAYLMRFTDELDENKMRGDQDVALASYASQYWVSHFQKQGPDAHPPLQELAQEFFHPSRRRYFLNSIRMYDLDEPYHFPLWYRKSNTIPDPLYYSCRAGFLDVSKWLLTTGADINAQRGYYGNALQAASEGSHESIMQLLLDAGANINAQGGYFGTALQAASYHGHKVIVRLLLDGGAGINAQEGVYGNALQAASDGGHESIVRLLLNGGADINAQGGAYGNALQAASDGGHESIV